MHICVCVHVCIPACVFVYYVCVHIHVYMYRYVFICVYVFVCVYAWAYVYLYVCIYVYIHTSIYVYLYVYMYLYVCLYVHVYVCFYYVLKLLLYCFLVKNPKQNRKPNKILLFPLHSYITWLFPLRVFRTFPWEMILKASGMRLHNSQTEGVRTLSPRSLWPGTAGSRILLSVPEPQITQT